MLAQSGIRIFEILEAAGTIATVVALVYAIRSFDKSRRIQEATFIKSMFESFQRDRQAILDNPIARSVFAEERGLSERDVVKESMGSYDINRAYMVFHMHEERLYSQERRMQDVVDIKALFQEERVIQKWQRVRDFYPKSFQTFIDEQILSERT